ncbi:AAA family ATPase [Nocardioides sp. SYSU D00038]|uniref:AAA family ATPase n=1 Tax=Nocardioides sp. SYSU D00038 TaxID=2812554 RepID=UPI001967F810|nr:AAA family ATPase [Nocardioides sp. SYSU D00038]
MPIIVDPDPEVVTGLLAAMPPGSHGVESTERLQAWLATHGDEYVVVLGPTLSTDDVLGTTEALRVSRPIVSTILVRDDITTELLRAAIKAGARDVVASDDAAGAFDAAIQRAQQLYVALRGPSGAMHLSKVISVFSPKGGVGKTTIAVNLALALSDKGARKVCLVDMDLAFGDVAITMQLFPTHSVEQAIGSEDTLDVEMLDVLLTRHPDSLMVLAAPSHPDVRERITPALVSRVIATLRETFDYVVLDMAPSFDEQVLTALDGTDDVVLVATLDVPTLKNVKVAVETLDMLHVAPEHRHLVLNRADDEVGINADKVEGILGMPVVTEIATSIDVAASTNAGNPILFSDPQHQFSAAIRDLTRALAGEQLVPVPAAAPEAGAPEGRGRRSRKRK